MNMKSKIKEDSVAQARGGDLTSLVSELRNVIRSARQGVATAVNTLQVMTNFEIGRRIVEHEQQGEKRAEYGAEVLKELSVRLTEEFGRGFSAVNLSNMRRFYLEWKERVLPITQTPSGKLDTNAESLRSSRETLTKPIIQTVSEKFNTTLRLSPQYT